jgi:hypothetical protein
MQRNPGKRYASVVAMKAELDLADQVRVTGLADRLQSPASWKPRLFQRPLVLATALLGPMAIAIMVMVVLLVRQHFAMP